MNEFDPKRAFLQSFDEELAARKGEEWAISGKVTKAQPHGEDEAWWRANGPQMVQRWIEWRRKNTWELWVSPDGKPAVELPCEVNILGERVHCFIDCVFATMVDNKRPLIVDWKTGGRPPDNDLQLGIYKVTLETMYPGVMVAGGAYWNGRTGELSPIKTLSHYTPQYISALARRLRLGRLTGVFLPNVGPGCRSCKMARFCAANRGVDSSVDPDSKLMG